MTLALVSKSGASLCAQKASQSPISLNEQITDDRKKIHTHFCFYRKLYQVYIIYILYIVY